MTQTSDPSLSASKAAESTAAATTHGLPSFADLAEAVDPAIVSIQASTIEKAPRSRGRRGQIPGQGVDPFEFFFGPRGRGDRGGQGGPGAPGGPGGPEEESGPPQQPDDYRSEAGGSGFVISPDGLIITNNHVIDGASEVKVHLGDRDYTAQVKGSDAATDLALLKINAGTSLKYLELGDSDRARVGDWVMVVGNPLNLNKTVTTGVISAKGRALGINDISFENFLQTDAAINFGNSGGPLVNLQGRVVGIASAINYGAENIGFAVPVNTLKDILPQLREKGKVSRGYLGISIQNLDWPHAQAFGLTSTDGALVGDVVAGTPAATAGVEHGDIITAVDGRHIKTTRDLIDYVSAKGPRATVTLTVLRNGKTTEREVKLSERPTLNQQASNDERQDGNSGINWLGLQYQDLSQGVRSSYNLPSNVSGVLITGVAATSPLYDQAVRPGSIISEVNGQPVHNVAEFERAVGAAKSKSYLRLYTLRFGRQGQSLPPFFAVVQVP
ncbi:MAG TPA: trypsin-like peptidase domain-containing protein [Thermoanaerobaculia bacterium]|nr:trypsin-like peptidase domain-containing protein [Thermoanaerobaculia bacterium]